MPLVCLICAEDRIHNSSRRRAGAIRARAPPAEFKQNIRIIR
ncbi:MAG: hypothetical protein SOU93_03235 [Campylobacter sp.]|nr:hypothetical protein [Campylobacter sp.]